MTALAEPEQGTAVARREEPAALAYAPVSMTPMEMLNRAVEQGANIDVLTKLMDLQERHERNQARKAFDRAMAAAKAEIPVVSKNREGHNNKRYADFAAFARAVDPVLAQFGLSYRFRTKQDDRIHVTCIISHEAGHSEENTLSGPADTSGAKNAIQSIGSTLSYLSRYSLTQSLGLAAAEDDDGAAVGNGETINDAQVTNLQVMAAEVGADLKRLCEYLKIQSLPELPAARYDAAVKAIEAKARQKAKPA